MRLSFTLTDAWFQTGNSSCECFIIFNLWNIAAQEPCPRPPYWGAIHYGEQSKDLFPGQPIAKFKEATVPHPSAPLWSQYVK
jgi:hypothetical protein